MRTAITLTILLVAILLPLAYVYRPTLGKWLNACFLPKTRLHRLDYVNIYLNGMFNRTCKITGVKGDTLMVYGTLALPLGYRGAFYAYGYTQDGDKLLYVPFKCNYRKVIVAEWIRRAFDTPECEDNLNDNDLGFAESEERKEVDDEM